MNNEDVKTIEDETINRIASVLVLLAKDVISKGKNENEQNKYK